MRPPHPPRFDGRVPCGCLYDSLRGAGRRYRLAGGVSSWWGCHASHTPVASGLELEGACCADDGLVERACLSSAQVAQLR